MKSGWGQRLRTVRGKVSQVLWGPLIGIGRATWANYEAEKSSPDLEVLILLNKRFGVSLDWIATGEQPPVGVDYEVLRDVIQAVQEEVPKIDAESKAKLILRLYKNRILLLQQEHEATPSKKGKAAS